VNPDKSDSVEKAAEKGFSIASLLSMQGLSALYQRGVQFLQGALQQKTSDHSDQEMDKRDSRSIAPITEPSIKSLLEKEASEPILHAYKKSFNNKPAITAQDVKDILKINESKEFDDASDLTGLVGEDTAKPDKPS
jgi:hypothetical protein